MYHMRKPLIVWITINCGKFWKRWEYQTTWPASWETYMQVRKQQLELDMEQETGSKLGKESIKAVYCYPAYLTSMQSTSCEMPAGWLTNWIKLAGRNINNLRYADDNHFNGRKWRGTKEPLVEGERGKWKSWLKTQHSENQDHGSQSHHFIANRWANNGNSDRLCFLGLQNHCRWWLQPWN